MECKKCGKEIPEGFEYCVDCENEMQEDAVVKITKEDIKKAQDTKRVDMLKKTEHKTNKPVPNDSQPIDLEGFAMAVRKDIGTLMAFVGAIFLYLSPFMKWAWRENRATKQSGTLFDLATKNISLPGVEKEVYTLGIKVFGFFAVLILLLGVMMLVLSACDYIRSLRFLGDLVWLRIAILAVLILIFVLIMTNSTYRSLMNSISINVADGLIEGGRGAGPVMFVAGLVFNSLATFFDIRQRMQN